MSEKTKDWQPDPSVPATLTRAEAEERLSRLSPTAQAMGNLDNAHENLVSFEACFVGGPPDCYTAWGILRAFVAGPDAPPRPADRAVTAKGQDAARLRAVHERVAALTGEARHRAAARCSCSFSSESMAIARGARIDGHEVVWPDGERYPRRTEGR